MPYPLSFTQFILRICTIFIPVGLAGFEREIFC